jgi:hypothetical protein
VVVVSDMVQPPKIEKAAQLRNIVVSYKLCGRHPHSEPPILSLYFRETTMFRTVQRNFPVALCQELFLHAKTDRGF